MKHKLTKISLFILNIAIVVVAFLFAAKFLKTRSRLAVINYWRPMIPFAVIWIGSGIWGLKYSLKTVNSGAEMARRVLKCDVVAAAIIFGLMFVFNLFHYSRAIVLGTMLGSVVIELFLYVGMYYALRFRTENETFASTKLVTHSTELEESQSPKFFIDSASAVPAISDTTYVPPYVEASPENSIMMPLWKKYLAGDQELFDFINDYLDLTRFGQEETLVLNSAQVYNIENEEKGSRQLFINLHKINDHRRLNRYIISVNEMLVDGGVYICHGQTILQRRNDVLKRFTPYLGIFIYGFEFILKRVFPKLPVLQGWYFAITKGRGRALSETEMLGRLYFCGFELIHKREINGKMHFILKKTGAPRTDKNPTYGPFIRLKRLGKDGKIIYVKKLRTMHPYSEYLQSYVYATGNLEEGGKFKNDFRVTSWGKILRKLWIDELPQFLNFFKGEVGLVGVRALSEHYFSLYPPDVQELRLKTKPGLLPPFYADMPKTFEEIVESERRYLLQKLEKPFRTDWKYFWKGVWNIVVKRERSG